jgi:hypothetical protein
VQFASRKKTQDGALHGARSSVDSSIQNFTKPVLSPVLSCLALSCLLMNLLILCTVESRTKVYGTSTVMPETFLTARTGSGTYRYVHAMRLDVFSAPQLQ